MFIPYLNNIKVFNNSKGSDHIDKINTKLLNKNNESIKIYNNFLFKSEKISNKTTYITDHLICNFKENNNLTPNINTYNNYLLENSNQYSLNNSLNIENAIFFNSFTSCHYYFTHLAFDFFQNINMFYDLLYENKEYAIIIEFIPNHNFKDYTNDINFNDINNVSTVNNNIFKLINFIRDINLNNKIYIISNYSICQNIECNSIFVKNLFTICFEENNGIKWIPLLSRFCKNNEGNYFCETLKNIISKKNKINIHYIYHKKKFFLLEKRFNSLSSHRNLSEETYSNLYNMCNDYCIKNNLKLVIWDNELTNRESIYEQFNISNNAEIIIGFGGSFWLFNYALKYNSKILILNIETEFNCIYEILYQMTFYSFNQIYQNKNINDIYLHFRDNDNDTNIENIVDNFINEKKI